MNAPDGASVLVISADEVALRLLKLHLERAGYAVAAARSGAEALHAARQRPPDLILSQAHLPDADGPTLARWMAEDGRTRPIPIVLFDHPSHPNEAAAALEGGADDYLAQPFAMREVLARVGAHIRRAQLKPALNPLTGLPGNLIIEQEIRRAIQPERGLFAVLYIDINHFKAYNDAYGFPAGDEAIRQLAAILTGSVADLGNASDLVGHIGGDDFVAITTPDRCDAIVQRLIADFDRAVPQLYSPADQRRGYIAAKDRQGLIKKYPLLSLSVAAVHNQYHAVSSHWEVGEIGAELKRFAKRKGGSAYVKDQRRV